jgi:hypothetical protein
VIASLTDGTIPFNTDATRSEKMLEASRIGAQQGLDEQGTIEILKTPAIGIDLSDPVVARSTLDEIVEAIRTHRMRSGGATQTGDVAGAWKAGQEEMLKRYEPVLKILKKVIDPKEVDAAINNTSWFESFFYKNAAPSTGGAGLGGGLDLISPIARGVFGE